MIVTKDFVLLNYPKTGSSYMRECIKQLYKEDSLFNSIFYKQEVFKELYFPKIYGNPSSNYKDQHGIAKQIPKMYQDRPILTVVRNPLERITSSYYFGWWKRNPVGEISSIEKEYPDYPNIDLLTYAKLLNNPKLTPSNLLPQYADTLGYSTRLFLIFYSEDPEHSAQRLISGQTEDLLGVIKPNIHFLKQEHLQEDLTQYIKTHTSRDHKVLSSVPEKNKGNYNKKAYDNDFVEYMLSMDKYLINTFYKNEITL
ncbi:hypothetical protein [Formosa sp. A9]|uniref:hypothetical protein n=1 Tax=Formosa sp. A9 TaxID=3442641 RepID=UPI003EBF6045